MLYSYPMDIVLLLFHGLDELNKFVSTAIVSAFDLKHKQEFYFSVEFVQYLSCKISYIFGPRYCSLQNLTFLYFALKSSATRIYENILIFQTL